ncbi:MAG: flagellar biosynthetic protein FliR [Paracoccaceae bacterium]
MRELLAPLAELSGQGEDWLWTAFLVFLRVGAVMALLPGFGEQVVPMRVRLAATVAFTAIVLPAVADGLGQGNPVLQAAGEVAAGLILGTGLRLLVLALQTAGAIAAQATSLAQLFAGAEAEPQPAIGHVLTVAGLALAMAAGLHVKVAALLVLSYQLLPAGQMPAAGEAAAWGTGAAGHCFALAFSLAAPFVLASTVYNLALGAINRAMPQLMVSFIGAPALTAGGLVLLVLAAPAALTIWRAALDSFLASPLALP